MIKLYGQPRSRALRCMWMLEEAGVDYELVKIDQFDPAQAKAPDYLKINPNGKVPALEDDGLVMFESLAINLYIAKTYGGALYPEAPKDEALTWQWSFWALAEFEDLIITVVRNRLVLPEEQRNEAAVDTAIEALQTPLKILDDALSKSDYLLGEDFTVADLNVASILSSLAMCKVDISHHAAVAKWLKTCSERPAMTKLLKKRS